MTPHTLIIAEAGVNHNGSTEMALKMIDAAADAGADIVKFQTFRAEQLVSASAPKADYQNRGDSSATQLDMLRRLELSPEQHRLLIDHCHERGIRFLSTAFDLDSVRFLGSLNPGIWKIPSGEIDNLPYLRAIAAYGQPVIVSTGMCREEDITAAIDALTAAGLSLDDITLLHCTTQYPTPPEEVNLLAIPALRKFGVHAVGYSDHTRGIEIPIAAVALGATVIEKHFTLDRSLPGPDHAASLTPDEFGAMVRGIRNVEKALGDGVKRIMPGESRNITAARKSIVARVPIAAGELLTPDNLTVKRPAGGLSPMLWDSVVGTHACRDFNTDQFITLN